VFVPNTCTKAQNAYEFAPDAHAFAPDTCMLGDIMDVFACNLDAKTVENGR
jgi:hypothetical protein